MAGTKEYTLEEVAGHNTLDDLWIMVAGKVYAIDKSFTEDHPGGRDVLAAAGGKDATYEWTQIKHSKRARQMMAKFHIGSVKGHKPADEDITDPLYVWPEERAWSKKKEQHSNVTLYLALFVFLLVCGYVAYQE